MGLDMTRRHSISLVPSPSMRNRAGGNKFLSINHAVTLSGILAFYINKWRGEGAGARENRGREGKGREEGVLRGREAGENLVSPEALLEILRHMKMRAQAVNRLTSSEIVNPCALVAS